MKELSEPEIEKMADAIMEKLEEEQMKVYSKKVIEEFKNPVNVGRMEHPDAVGLVDGNCGDSMEIYIKVKSGVIVDISFYTDGCGPTIASASMLTKIAKGKTLDEAKKISGDNIIFELDGLPDENMHCAHLAAGTLRVAIGEYRKYKGFRVK